jgi:endoglucanase
MRLRVVALVATVSACGGGDASPVASPSGGAPPAGAGWLSTSGSRIIAPDGTTWMGRGVNLPDTRSCGACVLEPPNVAEVKRRIDEAVDQWGANFLRLVLESYASPDGKTQWRSILDDPAYLADLRQIVAHVGTKRDVYLLVSLWHDPTLNAAGWPTADTNRVWQRIATTFANDAHVLFGVANEPTANFDGAQDAQVWSAMNDTVAAIRAAEDAAGGRRHLVAVQGTRQWARVLDYYVRNPIAAGGGANVIYETHVYDGAEQFQSRFIGPSRTLPVIVGEFGPVDQPGVARMTTADCRQLMEQADSLQVPYLAWTFHMRCPPNLLEDQSGGGCGVGMPLRPTAWGTLLRDHLLTFRRRSAALATTAP